MLVHSTCDVGVVEKENGLIGSNERLDRGAVALVDASVRDQEIEGVRQLRCLVKVIDDAGREATRMGDLSKPAIEGQLLIRRQVEPGVPRITVEASKENTVEPTVAAQVNTSLQDRAQRRLANVEPALIGAALGTLADDRLRELTGIGAPALPCSRHHVTNGGDTAAAQLL